jgi:hypothetical protein
MEHRSQGGGQENVIGRASLKLRDNAAGATIDGVIFDGFAGHVGRSLFFRAPDAWLQKKNA